MTEPQLRRVADGRFALQGPVTFATAGTLLGAGNDLFRAAADAELDLAGVSRVDSAALALLLEWLRQSEQDGRRLRFRAIPERLQSIAKLTGVADMLDG